MEGIFCQSRERVFLHCRRRELFDLIARGSKLHTLRALAADNLDRSLRQLSVQCLIEFERLRELRYIESHDIRARLKCRYLAAERARLTKEMQKADADIARVDAKLNNPNFMAKAPEEVVEEEKEKRAEAVGRKAKVAEALERLKSAT